MRRFFLFLSLGLVIVAIPVVTVAALAYGADVKRTGELEVGGIRQPVALTWDQDGSPVIAATSLPDLALGLGYVHAADHAWAMTLWRQAGRGGLGAWFGPEVRPLDRHAHALGFDALAQQTYRTLDNETRALLNAYAQGVNAALLQPGVAQGDAFVLMDVEPDAWTPWDALIVERLLAYLATPPPATEFAGTHAVAQDSSLVPFLNADSTFRATLGIYGTDGARAFVAPAVGGHAFVAHQPAGASALHLFAPVTLRLDGRTVAAGTLPGTLSIPLGWTGDSGWSVFLTSSLRLEAFSGDLPPFVHSRIVERNGDEVLLSISRDTTGLVLPLSAALMPRASPTPLDSTDTLTGWRLRWNGFRPTTDVSAFSTLLIDGPDQSFSLLRGDGMRVKLGETSILGTPPVGEVSSDVVFAGAVPASQSAGNVLIWRRALPDSLRPPFTAALLARSDASLWAAQTLPPLLRALGNRDSLDRLLDTPYAFLKGWNFRYNPEAVAPSIFETWIESHREYTGHAPDPADSLDVLLLPYTMRIALASLRDEFGSETTEWRWGRLQGGFMHPMANERHNRAFDRRFSAPTEGTGGHPTTLFPGPLAGSNTAQAGNRAGPAVWSAWALIGEPHLYMQTPTARIASPDTDRFGPAIFTLGDAPPSARPRLTLVPPS